MPQDITIENYDPYRGGSFEKENPVPKFRGTTIDDRHYIVDQVDLLFGAEMSHPIVDYANAVLSPDLGVRRDGLRIPARAYELISYDEDTKVAVAREVNDRALIEKIVVELEKERILDRVLRWQGKRMREASQ